MKGTKTPEGIFIGDSRHMDGIPDGSVDLVVTSPPYHVGMEYEKGSTYQEWFSLMYDVLLECDRKLKPNGRACINIVGIFRNPYIPLYNDIINIATCIGWDMRGIAIWLKTIAKHSTAWGSFASPQNPVLHDSHEFILTFQKGESHSPAFLENNEMILFFQKGSFSSNKYNSGITSEEFIEFTKAEWFFATEKASEVGHPAPFPDELPRRCILLFTDIGDTVLDPFAGSGTTYKVAKFLNRKPLIYEQNADYLPVIKRRIVEPVKIQSKGYELHAALAAQFPGIVDMTTQDLKLACRKLGSSKVESMNRIQLLEEYIHLTKHPNLTKFTKLVKEPGE